MMLIWKFRVAGYPFCHVQCARNFFVVIWDLDDSHDMSIKLGLQ